jgi:type I site-specific restriction endonuclease
MKNSEITIGQAYVIKAGKNNVNVKVIDFDQATQSWNCETENGKRVTVKESERFLNVISSEPVTLPVPESKQESKPEPQPESQANLKEIFARANAAKIAAQFGFCTQEQADSIVSEAKSLAEQLGTTVKDKIAKANAAKIAAQHGFCSKELAESLAQDAADAKNALRSLGQGHVGGHIRSGMSGLDAAYKILLETGQPMNAKTITKIALEQGIWNPQGATPDLTLSAALQNDVKKKGERSRFARADQPGHYILRNAQ